MHPTVVVTNVSKTFRRYHPDRPATIQEAVATIGPAKLLGVVLNDAASQA